MIALAKIGFIMQLLRRDVRDRGGAEKKAFRQQALCVDWAKARDWYGAVAPT